MDMQERADIFLFQMTVAGADRGYRSLPSDRRADCADIAWGVVSD